jgi:hypothetical protein
VVGQFLLLRIGTLSRFYLAIDISGSPALIIYMTLLIPNGGLEDVPVCHAKSTVIKGYYFYAVVMKFCVTRAAEATMHKNRLKNNSKLQIYVFPRVAD